MRVCFLAGSAVTALWQNTDWRVLPRGGALHAGWPGRPQRWRWHQCALLLSWHDPERPRALREREGGRARETKEMEGRNTKEGQSQRETQQIRNWEGGKRGREGMEGKGRLWGTVRQIGAGDELSGSIINPHPLLFNILKTHTPHILNRAPAQRITTREGEGLGRCKDPLDVKRICFFPKRSWNDFPLCIVFCTSAAFRHATTIKWRKKEPIRTAERQS